MSETPEVVVCGGGIAGGALALGLARRGISVTVLEQQDEYRDLGRGEMLGAWGIGEAKAFGVDDRIYAAKPGALKRWIQWDEVHHYEQAPTIDMTTTFVPGVDGPLAIHHCETSQSFTDAARDAGAVMLMGVRDVAVVPGSPPTISFTHDGRHHSLQPRIVIGAGGHPQPIARQLGLKRPGPFHHWGGGLAIAALDGWPEGVQAMGTEDNKNFMVFPQQDGRARLYLNFPASDARLYSGSDHTRRFLDAFRLRALPPELSEMVVSARPVGHSGVSPSRVTRTSLPYVEGVVLIGDEAGSNDTVLGTGLANSLRDVRIIGELLVESRAWSIERFEPYRTEREERLRRLNHTAAFLAQLTCEFGPDAKARRARAWDRMRKNPSYMIPFIVAMAGPWRAPDFAFSDYIGERLLADDGGGRAKLRRGRLFAAPQSLPAPPPVEARVGSDA